MSVIHYCTFVALHFRSTGLLGSVNKPAPVCSSGKMAYDPKVTNEHDKVTCRNCKRTRAWRMKL